MGCGAGKPPAGGPEDKNQPSISKISKLVFDKDVLQTLRNLNDGQLYTDPSFCGHEALYINPKSHKNETEISWKRSQEIVPDSALFQNGASHLDIVQGDLGDCWFLCACAAITLKPEILKKVIPPDNRFMNHIGLYHFCFWRFGAWVDVYIDDLLPTRDGELVYAQSTDNTEIWPSLIEKAYAKLNGCYETLQSGKASEGLLDLTGGLTEVYYPKQMKGMQLFDVMRQALRHGAFIACNTDSEHDGSRGLITGHAYSLTRACRIPTAQGTQDLIRIFNPWGGTEWTGDWADDSDKWNLVPEEIQKALGLTRELDGEFWMNFPDFCQHFVRVYICTLGPDFDMDGVVDRSKRYSFHGSWVLNASAGGCSDSHDKHATNPQYRFAININNQTKMGSTASSLGGFGPDNPDGCFLIISLMQKFDRSLKKSDISVSEVYINFRIYKIPDPDHKGRFDAAFFKKNSWIPPILGEVDYINTREVTCRFLLEPGHYVLVPSTFDPDIFASFLLRLYAWTYDFDCRELESAR